MELDTVLSDKIAHYAPSPTALASVSRVPLLLTVGITAAGKDTVVKRLIALHPDDYQISVSHTTRPMRSNDGVMEQNGVEYYFIDKPTALRMLEQGSLVEANFFASNLYGVSIAELERANNTNKILINDVDVNGVDSFVRLGLNVRPVFLLPPSFEVWRERLNARYGGQVNGEDLCKRLQTALAELRAALEHDYFYILVNDQLDVTVQQVHKIAHGQPVEARPARALQLAESLASHISDELKTLT